MFFSFFDTLFNINTTTTAKKGKQFFPRSIFIVFIVSCIDVSVPYKRVGFVCINYKSDTQAVAEVLITLKESISKIFLEGSLLAHGKGTL